MPAAPKNQGIRKPLHCLVIQMARLGDTIQSLMALRAAKQLYPELSIHLLVREKFADAALKVPWLDEVIVFPTDGLIGPVLRGEENEAQAVARVATWLGRFGGRPWDLLVNWTFSEASSYLATLVPAYVKLGYVRREGGTIACADGWSQYMQAIVQGSVEQNIHLTDVLTTQLLTALQIHVGDPRDPGTAAVSSKDFFNIELGIGDSLLKTHGPARKWIGIQLGAGSADKTWSIFHWKNLIEEMLKNHGDVSIVLLGGAEDRNRVRGLLSELGDQYLDRVVSLVGETDFDLWAAVVGRCSWIFAGDTAVIHLASVLGTRVMNLSLGPVKHQETGPYGNGHYIICPTFSGADLDAQTVYQAWKYASNEWSHRRQISVQEFLGGEKNNPLLSQIDLYRSTIRPISAGGGVHYESLLSSALNIRQWSGKVMGQVARAWYCGWVPPVGQELDRQEIGKDLIRELRDCQEAASVFEKICTQAISAAGELSEISSRLKSDRVMPVNERELIQKLGLRLSELDQLIERLGQAKPALRGFSHMSRVMMHNLRGQRIAELGQESAHAYRQIQDGLKLFKDWLQYTLELAKPRIVQEKRSPEVMS